MVTLAQLACAAALAVVALQPFGFRLPTPLVAAVAAIGALLLVAAGRATRALSRQRRVARRLAGQVAAERALSTTLEQCVNERTTELAEAERVLRRMWTLGQEVAQELHPSRVLERFVEAVVDVAQVDGGALGLLAGGEPGAGPTGASGDRVRIAAATGLGSHGAGQMLPLAGSAMGRVVRSGRPWREADLMRNPGAVYGPVWRAAPDGPARGIAVVPVQRGGETIGALELVSRAPRDFTDEELARVGMMTDMLSVALANAELVESLRQAEWRFRTLFRTAPDVVLTVGPGGRVREANDLVHDVTGLAPADVAGRRLSDLVAPEDRAALDDALARVVAGAPLRLEVRVVRADGDARVVELAASRLPEADPPLVLLIGRDTTAEREMRARLVETERLAAIGELVAGVAHEVNNPLASISAYAQLLLRDGAMDPALRDSVEVIKSETMRASQVVKDLLSFARRSTPQREPVWLNQLVERTLRLRNYELAATGIATELELAPDLPAVLGDARQLQQVVLNLITNSIQAMMPLRGGTLRVVTRAADGNVTLEVSDTGRGIPADVRARVFEPFFTTKGEGEGTGLGLSVSYGIVAAHGGSIVLGRTSASGTTFVVTLPSSGAKPERSATTPASAGAPRSAIAGTRVLFVDDEPTLRNGVEAFGRMRGFAVATAQDGESALAALQERSFDAVVCDLRMPGMDGVAFHRALSRESPGLARRTIFITGDVVSAGRRPTEAARQPTLIKPFTFERLEEALTTVLRGARV